MAISAADLLVNVRADVDDARRKIKQVDDDLDRLGGTFDVVGKAAKGFGVAAAAGFASIASQGAVSAVLALGASLAPMAGLLAALPAAVAAGGAAFATLALGLHGTSDAFKALMEGDPEKFAEALKKLAPNAQEFFKALQAAGPAFSHLRLHVQNELFAGLGFHVNRLARIYLPALEPGMRAIARGFNDAARAVADFLSRADVVMDVKSIFDNTGRAMKSLKPILLDLTAGFLDFATVGTSLLPEFVLWLEKGAERFRAWADEARRSGQIEEWIRNGATAAGNFGGILLNLGQIMGTVAEAARTAFGGSLLERIKESTQAVEDFLKSAEGQTALSTFFTSLHNSMNAITPVLKELFLAFTTGLVPVLSNLAVGVGPGLTIFLAALKEGLITIQPAALLLGEAVGELLANLAPLVPTVAEFIVKLVEFAAPLISNEKLVLALVAAFVGMKVIGGILGTANAAIDLFTSKAAVGFAKASAAVVGFVAKLLWKTALLVTQAGIWVVTMAGAAAKMIAQWALMSLKAGFHAAKIVAAWVLHSATAAATAVASMATQAGKIVAQWVVMSVAAAKEAAKIVAAWVLHSATAAATAVASMAVAAATVVAKWLLMAATATASALRMAAAWVIAMGPVGWVIAAVVGLAILIAKNWDTIATKTREAWNRVSTFVREAWNRIVTAVALKIAEVVTKAREVPGKIKTALGNLGTLLLQAGRDVMSGLTRGIGEAGSKAVEKAREMARKVKEAVTGFFGISSPSKVMHQIGEWTGEGLANGIAAMERTVARAGADMAAAAVPDVRAGAGLAPTVPGGTGASSGSVTVASGALQVIVQGNVTGDAVPQLVDGVDAAFRRLLAEIQSGRIPGRVG